jgi:hypothetical protein
MKTVRIVEEKEEFRGSTEQMKIVHRFEIDIDGHILTE